MTKVKVYADCGNSPKMTFLKDFNIAFVQGDTETILNRVTEDISWELVGGWKINGLEAFKAELDKTKDSKLSEATIERVVTHGKEGAANGILIDENGKKYAFADFYEFNSAKVSRIKSITTYMIEMDE